jgi:hypothetical protein
MNPPDASQIFAYCIALLTFAAGLALITGLYPVDVAMVRYAFGITLALMGIYRFAITFLKPKPSKWRRFTNEDDK